jgi:hypothetical protein
MLMMRRRRKRRRILSQACSKPTVTGTEVRVAARRFFRPWKCLYASRVSNHFSRGYEYPAYVEKLFYHRPYIPTF